MRDTHYATELASVGLTTDSGDIARIERLFVKATRTIEIRFSWWKAGAKGQKPRMMARPLDLPEADLLKLLTKAVREGVLVAE